MKFIHEIEKVKTTSYDLSSDALPKMREREAAGWEHYDTVVSPFFDKDATIYLFFKKPRLQKARTDVPRTLESLRQKLK